MKVANFKSIEKWFIYTMEDFTEYSIQKSMILSVTVQHHVRKVFIYQAGADQDPTVIDFSNTDWDLFEVVKAIRS